MTCSHASHRPGALRFFKACDDRCVHLQHGRQCTPKSTEFGHLDRMWPTTLRDSSKTALASRNTCRREGGYWRETWYSATFLACSNATAGPDQTFKSPLVGNHLKTLAALVRARPEPTNQARG